MKKGRRSFRFVKASAEYLRSTDNADLSVGDKDFSLPLVDCSMVEIKNKKEKVWLRNERRVTCQ